MPPEVLKAGYAELTRHAADGNIRVDTRRYRLEDAAEAWRALADGPDLKLAVAP